MLLLLNFWPLKLVGLAAAFTTYAVVAGVCCCLVFVLVLVLVVVVVVVVVRCLLLLPLLLLFLPLLLVFVSALLARAVGSLGFGIRGDGGGGCFPSHRVAVLPVFYEHRYFVPAMMPNTTTNACVSPVSVSALAFIYPQATSCHL